MNKYECGAILSLNIQQDTTTPSSSICSYFYATYVAMTNYLYSCKFTFNDQLSGQRCHEHLIRYLLVPLVPYKMLIYTKVGSILKVGNLLTHRRDIKNT